MPAISSKRKKKEESIFIYIAFLPDRIKIFLLTGFLLFGGYCINTLFDYEDTPRDPHKNDVVIKTLPSTTPKIVKSSSSNVHSSSSSSQSKIDETVTTTIETTKTEEPTLDDDDDDDDDNVAPLATASQSKTSEITKNPNEQQQQQQQHPISYDDDVVKMEDDLISPEYYIALFRDSIIAITLEDVSDRDLLADETTPQGKAKKWITENDERQVHPDDYDHLIQRYVLAVLFFATGGEKWHNGNLHWLSGVHECYWSKKVKGVKMGVLGCDEMKYITRIELVENNLQGSLPKEIGYLERLVSLDIQENRLSGNIPSTLGQIPTLKNLFVNSNNFRGTVPAEIGRLYNLELLLLDDNEFTGSIPLELCSLKEEKKLYSLWADCDGSPSPPVACDCCTMCCDGLRYCVAAQETYVTLDDIV